MIGLRLGARGAILALQELMGSSGLLRVLRDFIRPSEENRKSALIGFAGDNRMAGMEK